jgi:succinate dehydrogenase / fumarate reductase membrane anchor subunit
MDGGGDKHVPNRHSLDRQLCCDSVVTMDEHRMRTSLSRARGLGSAKDGVEYWWIQRVTAAALIPLTVWFVTLLVSLAGSDYNTFIGWFRTPFVTIPMVLLLISLFHHMALGLQVVVEDYVHSDRVKIPVVVLMRLACFALAAAGLYATLHIAFVV